MASAEVAVMANGDIGLERVDSDLDRALSRKREQLNKEIEQFRIQKDEEFRDFEFRLRQDHARDAQHDPPAPRSEARNDKHGDTQERPTYHRRDSSERRQARRILTARQALHQAFGAAHDSDSVGEEPGKGLDDVATPEYLDLVNGGRPRTNGSLHAGHADSEQQGPRFSASTNLHPPLLLPFTSSPINPTAVSWSAPEHSPTKTHHRSDSANSTLSISSLRSSMKDPKAPKSPKRVLFTLEDGVVSPSTSPNQSRKPNNEEPDAMQSLFTFSKRGRDKKKKNRRKERGDAERGRRGRDEPETTSIIGEAVDSSEQIATWTKPAPLTSERTSLPSPLAQANGHAQTPSAPVEDYEKIEREEDDLFAFDEDLDADTASDATASVKPKSIEEDEEIETQNKPLTETGTSPHAGSLPIEIKWPGRRDSGGIG